MEVRDGARKHGVEDDDMHHAVRYAVRSVELDDDLTLLIGADRPAGCWRSSWPSWTRTGRASFTPCCYVRASTDSCDREVIQMDETPRAEQLLDALDPESAEVENTEDLRAVAEAADTVAADEARLTEAVQIARAHGRSWTRIAIVLGVSRQAARQRFADKLRA